MWYLIVMPCQLQLKSRNIQQRLSFFVVQVFYLPILVCCILVALQNCFVNLLNTSWYLIHKNTTCNRSINYWTSITSCNTSSILCTLPCIVNARVSGQRKKRRTSILYYKSYSTHGSILAPTIYIQTSKPFCKLQSTSMLKNPLCSLIWSWPLWSPGTSVVVWAWASITMHLLFLHAEH